MLISKMRGFENQPQLIFRKSNYKWHSNPGLHQQITFTGFEFAAAFHPRTGAEPLHYRSTVLNCWALAFVT